MQRIQYTCLLEFQPRIDEQRRYLKLTYDIADSISDRLKERNSGLRSHLEEDSLALDSLKRQLFPLMAVSKGDIKGKKILDIGCGTRDYYFPILPYALMELEADVIGIDQNKEILKEDFPAYHVNLAREPLPFIEDSSIDFAMMNAVIGCPTNRLSIEQFWPMIDSEMERIIKPEGFFIYEVLTLGQR